MSYWAASGLPAGPFGLFPSACTAAAGALCQGWGPWHVAALVGLLCLTAALSFALGLLAGALLAAWLCGFSPRAWARAACVGARVIPYRRDSLELFR